LLPLTVLPIPAIGAATLLLPLMRLTIQTVGLGTRLGRGESLTIRLGGKGTRLGPCESLTIRLRGKGTRLGLCESLTIRLRGSRPIRSSLSALGAQHHKQTHRENNAPPSFGSHLIVLLRKICILDFCWQLSKPFACKGIFPGF
jgi:hypothetical protein